MWKIKPSGFIEVDIDEDIASEANIRNKKFLNLYGHSGTHRLDKGRQRLTGYLAESTFRSVFPNFVYSDNPIVDFLFCNKTFDIKAQGCNSEPKLNFSATLYEEQAAKLVDFLVFCRVKNDFKKVWICGLIGKEKFLKEAKFCAVGTKNNNFTYEQSRYEILYSDLKSPSKLLKSSKIL